MKVIRYPKKPHLAFHPTLRLEKTGYCPHGQWVGMMFKPGIFVGLKTIHEADAGQAIVYYLSELKRCGHMEVSRV